MSDTVAVLRGALADIAFADDMTLDMARKKARRIYESTKDPHGERGEQPQGRIWLKPLEGKYYGTGVEWENPNGVPRSGSLKVWVGHGTVPSARQLTAWHLTEADWEANRDGCKELACDRHYESREDLELALMLAGQLAGSGVTPPTCKA